MVLRALAPEEWLEAAREAGFDPGLDDDDGGKEAAEAHRRLYGGAGVGAEGGTGSLASAVSSVSVDGDGEWGEERLDDEFEADLRALLRPGSSSNGGSKGSAAAGGRRKGSTAAARNGSSKTHGKQAVASPAATAGLLLHHILALQTLAEAAEVAAEARIAAAAAAAGRPPPPSRRQLGLIRMLLKRAARAVDCDAGPWLRRIFKGAVKPERRLRELVAEMAGDQDAGGGSGEYDVQLQLYEYGMGSQGSLYDGGNAMAALAAKARVQAAAAAAKAAAAGPPLDRVLACLSREGAKLVIDRLKAVVERLPKEEH